MLPCVRVSADSTLWTSPQSPDRSAPTEEREPERAVLSRTLVLSRVLVLERLICNCELSTEDSAKGRTAQTQTRAHFDVIMWA